MKIPWYLMAKGKGSGGYKTASGPIVSVNDALAAPLRSLVANIDPVQAGSGDPSPDNVRPISGWSAVNVWVKPTYDPTANPTATIQLGDTYYGGTLDVTTGVLTVDRVKWRPDPEVIPNVSDLGGGWIRAAYASASSRPPYPATQQNKGLYSHGQYDNTHYSGKFNHAYVNQTSVAYLYFELADASAVMAYLAAQNSAGTPVEIVYNLDTPITIPLTPTEISTLQGQNNLWADSGDVTVEYLASGGANADLMKLAVAFMGRR